MIGLFNLDSMMWGHPISINCTFLVATSVWQCVCYCECFASLLDLFAHNGIELWRTKLPRGVAIAAIRCNAVEVRLRQVDPGAEVLQEEDGAKIQGSSGNTGRLQKMATV